MAAVGPLVSQLLDAQSADERAVQFPQLEENAHRVIDHVGQFDRPVLVPVGEAAQRLLAVVDHVSRGMLDIPVWTRNVVGRQVLLVGTVAVSMVEFDMTARTVRAQGAAHVHGCAISIQGPTQSTLNSFVLLADGLTRAKRTA